MWVKIVRQDKKIFDGQAKKVYAKTEVGDVEILDGHSKFVGILQSEKVKVDEKEIDIGKPKGLIFTDGDNLYIFVE